MNILAVLLVLASGQSHSIEVLTPTRVIAGNGCNPEFVITPAGGTIVGSCEKLVDEPRAIPTTDVIQGGYQVRISNMSGTLYSSCQLVDIRRVAPNNTSSQVISLECADLPPPDTGSRKK